jgi:hypothetical protein
MAPADVDQVSRSLADLKLQVNALETVAKNASLPETVAQARKTVRWSAIIVAVALIVSSLIKFWGDERVRSLEKRIEQLEVARDMRQP